MKNWVGYLTAGILLACTWALREFAKAQSVLVDMVYPYVTRMGQVFLADWSSGAGFCVWQMLLIVALVLVLTSIVLMIIRKWNPIRWLGWVCTAVAVVIFLNTGLYSLNQFSGPLSEDIRLEETDYTITELEKATAYYLEQANALSSQVDRDSKGNVKFDRFNKLADKAAEGFEALVYEESLSVFAGPMNPVKELGWAGRYTARGITGVTVGLTGEAAVNPETPQVMLPFAMCKEMARRASIAVERDANFGAFLGCKVNQDVQFRYSGYLMAYRYCLLALEELDAVTGAGAANRISAAETAEVSRDLRACNSFLSKQKSEDIKVCDLLTSWHIQEIVMPTLIVEEDLFDPMDKTQVDLSDHPNA